MNQSNELNSLESKFDFNKLQYKNIHLWPLLRHKIYIERFTNTTAFNSKFRTRSKIQLIKNFFFGFLNLFRLRQFEYIFFNNADKRLLTKNGKRFDIFFDGWADVLGQEKSLFIEWAITKHYSKKKTYSKYVISDLPFKFLIAISGFFGQTNKLSANDLDYLQTCLDSRIDLKKLLNTRFAEIKVFRLLFRLIKPKTVFVLSSFTKETVVIAAKLQGIKVIEAQHGYIGHNHQFYNSYYNFGPLYYPDYLLTFGEYEKENPPKGFIFKKNQLLPVGSLFLEHIKLNYENQELYKLKQKHARIFCVTLQNVEEDKFLAWINTQALQFKECLFIIKPRRIVRDYNALLKAANCLVFQDYSIYEVLKYSDFNITIYSTTAIEAHVFDVKTIFYNINGLSEKYFNPQELNAVLIQEGENLNEKHLNSQINNNNSYFKLGYYNNINKQIKYA